MKMKSIVNFVNFDSCSNSNFLEKNLTARRKKARNGLWHSTVRESELAVEYRNNMKIIFRRFYAVGIHKNVEGKLYCYEEIVVKCGNSFGTIRKNPDGEIVLSAHHKYARKLCWRSVCCEGRMPAALQADKRILPTLFALMQKRWKQKLYCMPTDQRRSGIYVKALKRVGACVSEHSEHVIRFEFR